VLTHLQVNFPKTEISFYRTSNGAELDFIIKNNNKIIAVECKTNISPVLSKGNRQSIKDINPIKTVVIAPVKDTWSFDKNITVAPLNDAIKIINDMIG